MRVTFDTNTLEKAASPERCDRDPLHPDYVKVHQAVVDGRIEGVFSETIITPGGRPEGRPSRCAGQHDDDAKRAV